MSDTLDEMNCPACHKPMKKIYLENQKFNIDICLDGCGGIFLDNREIKKLDESTDDINPIIEAVKNKEFEKVDESAKRICPACGHLMVKNNASHLANVQIDECYNCGGKFFDKDELVKFRNEFKTEKDRINAFNEYAKSVVISANAEFSGKKTYGSMLNDIIKNYKEFN